MTITVPTPTGMTFEDAVTRGKALTAELEQTLTDLRMTDLLDLLGGEPSLSIRERWERLASSLTGSQWDDVLFLTSRMERL